MFYLQNILSPFFHLASSLCFFSYSLMCAGTHAYLLHTFIRPHTQLIWCSSTLLGKNTVFLPLLKIYHTKPACAGHISYVTCVLSSPFSAFFSLLSPPCRPICHTSVSGVFAVSDGVKDRGVEQGAFSCQSYKPSQYPALELGMILG